MSGQTPVERYGHLRAEGRHILGKDGTPVVLRGMSLFWSLWEDGSRYYNADAIHWLVRDWNITVIRAAIGVVRDDKGNPQGYLLDPAPELAKLDRVVAAAIAAGIYVIIDWHAHEPESDAAEKFFQDVARRYGKHPSVIFETWNEPLGQLPNGPSPHDWVRDIKPHHERMLRAIRPYSENLVILGTPNWSQLVNIAKAQRVNDKNVAYALHYYAATHGQWLRDEASRAIANDLPLFVSEWGVCDHTGNGRYDFGEARLWWKFLEDNQISQVNWSVSDKAELASALRYGAAAEGLWRDDMLTEGGLFVRAELRTLNRL